MEPGLRPPMRTRTSMSRTPLSHLFASQTDLTRLHRLSRTVTATGIRGITGQTSRIKLLTVVRVRLRVIRGARRHQREILAISVRGRTSILRMEDKEGVEVRIVSSNLSVSVPNP